MTVIKQYNPGSSLWEPVLVGAGVPPGGTVGQVIVKASSVDYDTEWGAGGFDQATADALYVNVTGDTMTGDLTLTNGGGIEARYFNSWGYVGAESTIQHIGCDTIWINDSIQIYKPIYLDGTGDVPTDPRHATSKSYVDGRTAAASATASGLVELATPAEATAQTDNVRAVTPLGLADRVLTSRALTGTAPIAIGGAHTAQNLSADRTISLVAAGVANSHLATMPANTVKMNNTAGVAGPTDVTVANLLTALGLAVPVTVAQGGSGRATATTAYGLLAAGTTATGVQQTVTPAASGFLKTTSATALPAWATIAQADITNLVTDLGNKQPLDTDLTTIAGLTATAGNIIQSVAGVWASRTPTEVKAALVIAESDVTNLVTDLSNKQPLDADLTAIAALAQASGSVIQSNGTTWFAATPAQQKTALAIAQSDVTNLVNDLSNKQPLDSDLSAIAILAHSANSMIQSNGSAWIAATPAQVKTGLAITKTDVGLGNVDNTSDANKLISTATQTALDAKQPLDADLTAIAGLAQSSGSTLQSNGTTWIAATPTQAKTALALTKSDVGLDQVTNTSDVNKPVSTAQATADALRVLKAGDTMTGILKMNGVGIQVFDATGVTQYASISGLSAQASLSSSQAGSVVDLRPANATRLSVSSTLTTSSNPIALPADPASALHAATKQYVDGLAAQATLDTRYVNVAGDTLTGFLTLHADPSSPFHAVTKQYVDGFIPDTLWVGTDEPVDADIEMWWDEDATPPVAPGAISEADADLRYLNVNGDVMAGILILSADPVDPLDAATKQYVDNHGGITQEAADLRYVYSVGDSMTGPLVLSGDPAVDLEAATKRYVDFTVAASQTGITEAAADARYVNLTGDTMTGVLTVTDLHATNVFTTTPTVSNHAANKAYADTKWKAWSGTQAQYDALGTYDTLTLYVVTG